MDWTLDSDPFVDGVDVQTRVAGWADGNRHHRVVFEDYISTTTTVYTGDRHYEWLGDHDMVGLHCVVDQQNAAGGITVVLQHSSDARNWLAKGSSASGAGQINTAGNVPASGVASLSGFDNGESVTFRYARLAITLVSPCTSAHVRICATRRLLSR